MVIFPPMRPTALAEFVTKPRTVYAPVAAIFWHNFMFVPVTLSVASKRASTTAHLSTSLVSLRLQCLIVLVTVTKRLSS